MHLTGCESRPPLGSSAAEQPFQITIATGGEESTKGRECNKRRREEEEKQCRFLLIAT